MKRFLNLGALMACCFFAHTATSQTYTNDSGSTLNRVQNGAVNTVNNQRTNVPASNAVFIQQVGQGNVANAAVSTTDGQLTVVQNGDQNNVDITSNAPVVNATIVQLGNNHNFDNSGLVPGAQEVDVNVTQRGNNQSLDVFGSNSISQKLKVNMQGQNQQVIVRSFNN